MASKVVLPDPLDVVGNSQGKSKAKSKTQAVPAAQAKGKPDAQAKGKPDDSGNGARYGRRAGQPAASELIRTYFIRGGTVAECFALLKKQFGKDNVKEYHIGRVLQTAKRNGWGFKESADGKIKLSKPASK